MLEGGKLYCDQHAPSGVKRITMRKALREVLVRFEAARERADAQLLTSVLVTGKVDALLWAQAKDVRALRDAAQRDLTAHELEEP